MASRSTAEKVGWTTGLRNCKAIWSWGANSYGQLAQGTCDDRLVPSLVSDRLVPSSVSGCQLDIPVARITGGGGHTLVVTDDGCLWTCGSNNKGQLGLGTTQDVQTLTKVMALTSRVVMATGGWDFSLAITDTGEVYTWGSNVFGQLGDPDLPDKTLTPTGPIHLDERVTQVAAGLRHSVALTESGCVYCWGHCKKGQCGRAVQMDGKLTLKQATPVRVELPEKSVYIVAGSYHTAALSDMGKVYVWGCNKYGQSTLDPKVTVQVTEPHLVDMTLFGGSKVKLIKSGWTHMVAKTESGDLYSWGRGDYGQLGRSRLDERSFSPTPGIIDTKVKMRTFECGSEHTLFISEDNKLSALGWNEHGLCGTGNEENVDRITNVDILRDHKVVQICLGGGHCFVMTDNDIT